MFKRTITAFILILVLWGFYSEISGAKTIYLQGDTEINITRWEEIPQWEEETNYKEPSLN